MSPPVTIHLDARIINHCWFALRVRGGVLRTPEKREYTIIFLKIKVQGFGCPRKQNPVLLVVPRQWLEEIYK